MDRSKLTGDTPAWTVQVWSSFIIAVTSTLMCIYHLPVDGWMRGFTAVSLLFTVSTSFTLAKTLRDSHESERMLARLTDAKAEKIIREYEFTENSVAA